MNLTKIDLWKYLSLLRFLQLLLCYKFGIVCLLCRKIFITDLVFCNNSESTSDSFALPSNLYKLLDRENCVKERSVHLGEA
jgi:hypothetical protein